MLLFFLCSAMHSLHAILMCGMSVASVKQSLMNGVTVVDRVSCTAIEPRHGRGGTARQLSGHVLSVLRRVCKKPGIVS
jgi:hypothetical protein